MRCVFTILFVLLVVSAAVAETAQWQELETGLELSRFDASSRSFSAAGDLTVLRIEPRIFALRLLSAGPVPTDPDVPEQPGRNVAQWCEEFDLVAAINAGMYQEDRRTHVGFCKKDGKVVNGFANDYLSAAAFEPIDPADPPFHIFDLDETPLHEVLSRYKNVVQNLRLIKHGRQNRWQPASDKWREAALAEDSRGRILFIFCRSAWSMHDFNEILLALPLEVVAAQHLEGRGPARFWLAHPAYSTGPGDPAPGPALPNVLGLVRRFSRGGPTDSQLNVR